MVGERETPPSVKTALAVKKGGEKRGLGLREEARARGRREWEAGWWGKRVALMEAMDGRMDGAEG